MNAEQRERARKATQAIYLVTDAIVADDIAALLRAGIAASEECERLRAHIAGLDGLLLNTRASDFSPQVQERVCVRRAWLAAWDAEWRAQRLRALLERAAGALSGLSSVTEDMARTGLVLGRTDTDRRLRDAGFLLAEIEGALK